MRRIAVLILLASGLAGCGVNPVSRIGTGSRRVLTSGLQSVAGPAAQKVSTPAASFITSQLSPTAPKGLARPVHGRRIGATQSVDTRNAHLTVTVREVIDPLLGAGVKLRPHTRAVGVLVQIRSAGPALYDSSATGDFHLVLSAGRATPALATRGPCRTPHQDFDRYITGGEDRVGCVAFMVRQDARIEAVRFDPHAQRRGRLTWVLHNAPGG